MIPGSSALLEDRNNDGVPDYINARIYVASNPSPAELAAAANIAARLAFETQSMDLPIGFSLSDYDDSDPTIAILVGAAAERFTGARAGSRSVIALGDTRDAEAFARTLGAETAMVSIGDFHESRTSREISLARLFSPEGLLGDSDSDLIPDCVETIVVLGPDVCSLNVIDLAARIALETTGLRLPLVVVATGGSAPAGATLIGRTNPHVQRLIEDGQFHPVLEPHLGRIEVVRDAAGANWALVIAGADPNGEAEAIRHVAERLPFLWDYGKGHTTLSDVERSLRRPRAPAPPMVQVYDKTYDLRWEVDEARARIAGAVWPVIRNGSSVELELRVSEPLEIRQKLAEEIRLDLIGRGAADPGVLVLPAYKQGYGWMDEILKPLVRDASRIEICCRSTAAEMDVVESPIRWLQELYPIDEVLARDLGISCDRISFRESHDHREPAYRVQAFDSLGRVILDEAFEPRFVYRPLLDLFPDYATVRVTTGWLKAAVDGVTVVDERVETDPERFWNTFQSETLQSLYDYMMRVYEGRPEARHAPHFETLEVELWMSEPDGRIGIDEERISSLEALHEDLYFETLLFFEVLGRRCSGQPFTFPGRIIPRVHSSRHGRGPTLRVRLSGKAGPGVAGGARAPDRSRITGITVKSSAEEIESLEGLQFTVAEGARERTLQGIVLARTLASHKLVAEPTSPDARRPVQWNTPIDPEECSAIVSGFNGFPEARAFLAGHSYLERPIWALDVMAPLDGKYFSQAKASVTKPVLFITGRQHANEVSSTSHILKLVELLITEPGYRKLLDRVNLVVQPITNPDGADLACELQRITPDFMLHAGYYGSLGVDVTAQEWETDPIYPEARARRELWQMWLPDVVLNPHGYPSHEWIQLFAGYTAWVRTRESTARDWWIPRGWFIPHFNYIDDPEFPHHPATAFALRGRLIAAANRTMNAVNERMMRRYRKYGAFDSSTYGNQNRSGYGTKPNPNASGFMLRHPRVTVLECVTEAPDETAHGDWLKLVAQAGLDCSLAVMGFLAESSFEVKREIERYADATVLRISRARPVLPPVPLGN